ncbi:FG-GAP-like repeat-containing protein [Streptomyces longispororuber]|uniref:FG-GAP-like repeat-containing protein n=1 Tax=Streptomyces longispororuber TaxID=68230 RepID=UPI00210B2F42|nr:FG-GAP-like repeat-containing protein [Streptomyces longispororuber]MCQ4214146.1 FG-GAP and VCBS repeat-containing protein [Streptomyces longispororuber]
MPKHKRTPVVRPGRTRLAAAATAAAALTGGLVSLSAGTASAVPGASATQPHEADFNLDGYPDVAVSSPEASVGGHAKAGQITVFYGSASGISAARRATITQSSTGVPGTPEAGDQFGYATSPGDFNRDGFTDLAVGTPYEDMPGDADGGTVTVLWGSSSGLKGGTTLNDPAPSSHDRFGFDVAAGDFDGDAKTDLATADTSKSVRVFKGGISKTDSIGSATAVTTPLRSTSPYHLYKLTAGDVNADGKDDLLVSGNIASGGDYLVNYYLPGTASGPSATATRLPGGVISDIGDINGDGFGDVVTGLTADSSNSEEQPGTSAGGNIHVTYGSATGPDGGTTVVSQDTAGVPGSGEASDLFGWEVSVGDINGDGLSDIAVGAISEDGTTSGTDDSGAVTVLYGSGSGVTGTGSQTFTQNTAGVPGSSERSDLFGTDVLLSDFNADGRSDLAIGVSGENAGNGALTVLKSAGGRITTTGAVSLSPSAVGVSTSGAPQFGAVLGG